MQRAVLVAVLVLLVASAEAAAEQRLAVASGRKGQTYHEVYAKNLAARLGGVSVAVRTTSGSAENLDLLSKGAVDAAFAQADVYALRMAEEPDAFGGLQVLGPVAEECVYIAYRTQGHIQTLKQLVTAGAFEAPKLAVGEYGTGLADSWSYLVTLLPGLAGVEVEYKGGPSEIDQLKAGNWDAVGWITDPTNLDHAMLKLVRASEELALMNVDDPALGSKLPGGQVVYAIKDVSTGSDAALKTVCTTALLFGKPGLDGALAKKLTAAAERLASP